MQFSKVAFHAALMLGNLALMVLVIINPFLPGEYDGMAMPLSGVTQMAGVLGLLLAPVGLLWLAFELRERSLRARNLPVKSRRYAFALAALIVASLIALVLSLAAWAMLGLSFGLLALTLWIYTVSRLLPRLKSMRNAEPHSFNAMPLYLIILPLASLFFQLTLAAPLTSSSRNRAIASSAEMIGDIEAYRDANGGYPAALQAVWKDYYPTVVGIEKYHYMPAGDTYNLYFEQPRFLLDNIGTREFVVYNPNDDHFMISHTSWILLLSPNDAADNPGWYESHDAPTPHWKYFWFD